MKLIYYDGLKPKTPVNTKRILISTAIALFRLLAPLGYKPLRL